MNDLPSGEYERRKSPEQRAREAAMAEAPNRIWIPGDHNLSKAVVRKHGDYYTERNYADDIEFVRVDLCGKIQGEPREEVESPSGPNPNPVSEDSDARSAL